jgi:hypothetical protein
MSDLTGRMLTDRRTTRARRNADPEDAIAERDEHQRMDVESDTRGTPAEQRYEAFIYGEQW